MKERQPVLEDGNERKKFEGFDLRPIITREELESQDVKLLLLSFVEGIESGEITEDDIISMLEERYLKIDHLSEIQSNEDLEQLKSFVLEHTLERVLRSHKDLVKLKNSSKFVLEQTGEIAYTNKGSYYKHRRNGDIDYFEKVEKISHQEALRLMGDIKTFDAGLSRQSFQYNNHSDSNLSRWGYRFFESYSDNVQDYTLRSILEKSEEVSNINIFDVGGGIGKALKDLKNEFGDKITTYNITSLEETAIYPADHNVIALKGTPFFTHSF